MTQTDIQSVRIEGLISITISLTSNPRCCSTCLKPLTHPNSGSSPGVSFVVVICFATFEVASGAGRIEDVDGQCVVPAVSNGADT